MKLITVGDYRRAARAKLSPMAWRYFRSGADAEETLRENLRAFGRWQIWPRVLVDVSALDLSTTLLGRAGVDAGAGRADRVSQAGASRRRAGDRAGGGGGRGRLLRVDAGDDVARGGGRRRRRRRAGSSSTCTKIAGLTAAIVERARGGGVSARSWSPSTRGAGPAARRRANGFALPLELRWPTSRRTCRRRTIVARRWRATLPSVTSASFGWRDLERLRAATKLPIVLKGILRGDDARAPSTPAARR